MHTTHFISLPVSSLQTWRVLSLLLLTVFSVLSSKSALANSNNNTNSSQAVCVHIASYKIGYEWQDGIDAALSQHLNQACQLKTFYMNTQNTLSTESLTQRGEQAKDFIEREQPNVVIVSDDDAVKYVLQPYFRDHRIPFVFCGLNNGGAVYDLPYSNATGMVEYSPVGQLLKLLFSINPAKTHVAYLNTLGTTAEKDALTFHRVMKRMGTPYTIYTVANQEEWRAMYLKIHNDPHVDLVFLGNTVAFKNWNHADNLAFTLVNSQKLSFAEHNWMMPYVSLGILKSPYEQGAWAAQTAKAILNGMPVERLPVVPNRNFQLWSNLKQLNAIKQTLPDSLLSQAILYSEPAR
ncbi:ABC transporter substrate-binding protein [Thiomicrorhabdus aquaedulcis]|uniref:ABC transporter substrate-binding protein n=1 Tax=Thiomicrorhabdus aquaedulcis TaxID=2211106 RepID=UPI001562DE1F|nr:ABC transporter substrate binding protein [Thiomicrorhabdus aquaedulcis]